MKDVTSWMLHVQFAVRLHLVPSIHHSCRSAHTLTTLTFSLCLMIIPGACRAGVHLPGHLSDVYQCAGTLCSPEHGNSSLHPGCLSGLRRQEAD